MIVRTRSLNGDEVWLQKLAWWAPRTNRHIGWKDYVCLNNASRLKEHQISDLIVLLEKTLQEFAAAEGSRLAELDRIKNDERTTRGYGAPFEITKQSLKDSQGVIQDYVPKCSYKWKDALNPKFVAKHLSSLKNAQASTSKKAKTRPKPPDGFDELALNPDGNRTVYYSKDMHPEAAKALKESTGCDSAMVYREPQKKQNNGQQQNNRKGNQNQKNQQQQQKKDDWRLD